MQRKSWYVQVDFTDLDHVALNRQRIYELIIYLGALLPLSLSSCQYAHAGHLLIDAW